MSPDPLTDVLASVRLTGAVFFAVEGTAPWVAEAPPGQRHRRPRHARSRTTSSSSTR